MSGQPVTCLMLDVDGVIVTGHPEDGRPWTCDIERDLGIAPDRLRDAFFAPHWENVVTGRSGLMEVIGTCLPDLAPALTPQQFLDYWFDRDSRLDHAVLADCDGLRARGVRVYLATNQEHLRATHLMERLGLANHVDGMIYSARLGVRKPDLAFFTAAARQAEAAPDELLLVDDTLANVEAARRAGWRAVHWMLGARLADLLECAEWLDLHDVAP